MESLLRVRSLKVSLHVKEDLVKIVDGVDLSIGKGETVGLVGETGSGKTVTALSILGILHPLGKGKPLWKIEGEVLFNGKDMSELSKEELRRIRGTEIALISQNPIPSLHPMEIIGYQTGEAVEVHREFERQEVTELVVEHLGKVEISDADKRYYHVREQFSGGEGQRILIAMALIRNPSLLVADEPTSSLDVTVQRQVLELLKAMKKRFRLSMLLITHNLGVIAEMSDYIYVMYAGKIVERSDVLTIFSKPAHPFTRGLLASVPRIDMDKDMFEFGGVPGEPHNPFYPVLGCSFHPRCRYAAVSCSEKEPQLTEIEPGHWVACLRINEIFKSRTRAKRK